MNYSVNFVSQSDARSVDPRMIRKVKVMTDVLFDIDVCNTVST